MHGICVDYTGDMEISKVMDQVKSEMQLRDLRYGLYLMEECLEEGKTCKEYNFTGEVN